MTKLILAADLHQIFLAVLSRRCHQPAKGEACGNILQITGVSPADIAYSLSTGVFPVLEIRSLTKLAAMRFPDLSKEEQRAAVMRGWELAQINPAKELPFAGPLRYEYLADEFEAALAAPLFDITGYIRFRMKGYEDFLHLLLTEAEDSLLAEAEDAECRRLFSELAKEKKTAPPDLHIFFSEDNTFHLWQRDGNGIALLEGGRLPGLEGMLLADIISKQPRRIFTHDAAIPEQPFLAKLREVFGDRLQTESPPFQNSREQKLNLDKNPVK